MLPKRLRYIISSTILTFGFVWIQFLDSQFKFLGIAILVILSIIGSYWSFYEGLGKNATLFSIILPMLFTLGVGIFWFLLPSNIFTRIPTVILYFIGVYILLSTMNIYTVSSQKTIALLRAARGVGFVLTLLTAFFIFDAILSVRQNPFVSVPLVFVSSVLLFLQGFWSIDLEKEFNKKIITLSLISSYIVSQLAIMIFFWPVSVVVGSLFLTASIYLLLGIGQAKLEDRLFPSIVREYLTVGMIVLIGMFFATRWG